MIQTDKFEKYIEWNDSSICGMALLKSQIGDFIGRSDLEKFFNSLFDIVRNDIKVPLYPKHPFKYSITDCHCVRLSMRDTLWLLKNVFVHTFKFKKWKEFCDSMPYECNVSCIYIQYNEICDLMKIGFTNECNDIVYIKYHPNMRKKEKWSEILLDNIIYPIKLDVSIAES